MRITTITVGRVYNTGNYTSRRFEATAQLESEDEPDGAIIELADYIDQTADRLLGKSEHKTQAARGDDLPF